MQLLNYVTVFFTVCIVVALICVAITVVCEAIQRPCENAERREETAYYNAKYEAVVQATGRDRLL